MTEFSTEESENIVREIFEAVSSANEDGNEVKHFQQIVYDVEYLLLESNSGASYEQYFRWATVEEINRVILSLKEAGLDDIAELTEKAIKVAFPKGVPANDYKKVFQTDWKKKQEKELRNLFIIMEKSNGQITNTLADYAKKQMSQDGM